MLDCSVCFCESLPVTESAHRLALPVWCSLLCLVLVAFWLRWDVYPQTYFADELIPRAVVKHMQASHSLDTNWENADWRGDYAGGFYRLKQYNFSSYHTLLLVFRESANMLGLRDVPDLVVYRAVSLLCQLACLLLVFATAFRFAGATAGLLAAAFFAVMPQAVVDAHYARPESFVMLLVALAVWLAWRGYEGRRWQYGLAEAAIWGVAFACKFSFFPMVILAGAAQVFRFRRMGLLLLWCASFILGVGITAPYILLDAPGFAHGIGLLLNQYAPHPDSAHWFDRLLPSAHDLFPYLNAFFSIPVLFLVAISVFNRNKKSRCFSIASLLVSFFYLLLFARQGVFFERNLSHLLPLWAVMFALGFLEVFNLVRFRWYFWLLAMLFFLWPLYLSSQINGYFFRDMEAVKRNIYDYEDGIKKEFSAGKIIPFKMLGGTQINAIAAQDILRIPQHKLAGMEQVKTSVEQAGFRRVGRIGLPLSFLPYNQLQINHFPPEYTYYLRETTVGKGAKP